MTKTRSPKQRNFISSAEQIIYALAPFAAAVVLTFMSFVDAEFKFDFSMKYTAKSVLTAVLLLAFYFPFRAMFKNYFLKKPRIANKVFQYSARASLVYNGHYREFIAFSEVEFKERREKFINRNLQLVDMTYREFLDRYKFSIHLINQDDNLSKRQKVMLRKIVLLTKFIKPQNPDKVLPGTEHGTEFRRVKSSMERKNMSNSVSKVLRTGLTAFAIIGIFFTVDYTEAPLAIATAILVRLFAGIGQILIACFAANRIINIAYFNELSEKNQYMDDFIEYQGLRDEYNALVTAIKNQQENQDGFSDIIVTKVEKEVQVIKEVFVPSKEESDES